MYNVTFIVRDYYDSLTCEKHDTTFSGLIFDSIEEIKIWKETPKIEIVKVEDLHTGEEINI